MYFWKNFFLEFGVSFTHLFSADRPQNGYLRPFLTAGLRF
jgi:hypothetical protein